MEPNRNPYILEEEELVDSISGSQPPDYEPSPNWNMSEKDQDTLNFTRQHLKDKTSDWPVAEIRYGTEERAVDVPDGASAVSAATTCKAKAGKSCANSRRKRVIVFTGYAFAYNLDGRT